MGGFPERIGAFLIGFGSVCLIVGLVETFTKSGGIPRKPVPTKEAAALEDHYAANADYSLQNDEDYGDIDDTTSVQTDTASADATLGLTESATTGLTNAETQSLLDHYGAAIADYSMKTGLPRMADTNSPLADATTYWTSGAHKTLKVYHQTSPEVCRAIMAGNFHLGKGGLCGKAVYFALSPEVTKTKAITPNSHGGCMIEAEVDVGKQGYYYWNGGADRRFTEPCGGWNKLTGEDIHRKGYDSIVMRQGDGDEIIVFEPERITSKRILPFKCEWMCAGQCQKHWPPNCPNHNAWAPQPTQKQEKKTTWQRPSPVICCTSERIPCMIARPCS